MSELLRSWFIHIVLHYMMVSGPVAWREKERLFNAFISINLEFLARRLVHIGNRTMLYA